MADITGISGNSHGFPASETSLTNNVKFDSDGVYQQKNVAQLGAISGRRLYGKNEDMGGNHDDIWGYMFVVLLAIYSLDQARAAMKGEEMQHDTRRARDTQDLANQMDGVINKAAQGDDKTRELVPDNVKEHMRNPCITVDGMSIDDYIKKNGDENGALNKGGLQAVKAALDNSVNRDTDLSAPNQLQLNKLVQMCGTIINMSTDLTSKLFSLLQTVSQIISRG